MKPDSLLRVLGTSIPDSSRIKTLHTLAWLLKHRNPDTSIFLTRQALTLAEKTRDLFSKGACTQNLGVFHYLKADYDSALHYYDLAGHILQQLEKRDGEQQVAKYRKMRAKIYSNIALIYSDQSNFSKALKYSLMNLKLCEESGERRQIGNAFSNLGVIYRNQSQLIKAEKYFSDALQIAQTEGDGILEANTLGNLGTLYQSQAEEAKGDGAQPKKIALYRKAIAVYDRLMKLDSAQRNAMGIAADKGSLGSIYYSLSALEPAYRDSLLGLSLLRHKEALEIARQTGNRSLEAGILTGLGELNFRLGILRPQQRTNYFSLAGIQIREALSIAEELEDLEAMQNAEITASRLDSASGNFSGSLRHYKRYILFRDSISSAASTRKQTQLEMLYEFDKKQAADSVRVAEEKKVAAAELKAEKNKRYTLYGGLALVLLCSGFIYNRFRITKKQKTIIESQKQVMEEQKKIVEERNRDILDSIYYARRIQRSLMRTEKQIARILNR